MIKQQLDEYLCSQSVVLDSVLHKGDGSLAASLTVSALLHFAFIHVAIPLFFGFVWLLRYLTGRPTNILGVGLRRFRKSRLLQLLFEICTTGLASRYPTRSGQPKEIIGQGEHKVWRPGPCRPIPCVARSLKGGCTHLTQNRKVNLAARVLCGSLYFTLASGVWRPGVRRVKPKASCGWSSVDFIWISLVIVGCDFSLSTASFCARPRLSSTSRWTTPAGSRHIDRMENGTFSPFVGT